MKRNADIAKRITDGNDKTEFTGILSLQPGLERIPTTEYRNAGERYLQSLRVIDKRNDLTAILLDQRPVDATPDRQRPTLRLCTAVHQNQAP